MPPEGATARTWDHNLPLDLFADTQAFGTTYPGAPLKWPTPPRPGVRPEASPVDDLDLRFLRAFVWIHRDAGQLTLDGALLERITDYVPRMVQDPLWLRVEDSRTGRVGSPPLAPRGQLLLFEIPGAPSTPPPRPAAIEPDVRSRFPEAQELRELTGLTADECADLCGVKRSTFYTWLSKAGAPRGRRRKRVLEILVQLRSAGAILGHGPTLSTWLRTPAAEDAETPLAYLSRHELRVFRGLVNQARPAHPFRFQGSPGARRLALERLSPTPRIETLEGGADGGEEEEA